MANLSGVASFISSFGSIIIIRVYRQIYWNFGGDEYKLPVDLAEN